MPATKRRHHTPYGIKNPAVGLGVKVGTYPTRNSNALLGRSAEFANSGVTYADTPDLVSN